MCFCLGYNCDCVQEHSHNTLLLLNVINTYIRDYYLRTRSYNTVMQNVYEK